MNDRDSNLLFEMLEPPPGGVQRLGVRIARDRRRRARNRRFAIAGVGMAALAALVLMIGSHARKSPSIILPGVESDLLAIRAGLVEPPTEVVSIPPALRREFAVQRIPTSDDRVVFYLVGRR